MTNTKPIRRIAIIGTGVIGASWAAQFLAKGLEVVATDIAPDAETALRKFVKSAWPALERLGLSPGASLANLKFNADLAEAVVGVDLVQENGPERLDFKQKLYKQLDELLPPDVIIASSSSGIKMSDIQSGAALHPERCVIGHPFNPPHLIPLVEVVGGTKTSEQTIQRAIAFYKSIGKKAVRLNKEMPGHVANRLQGALAREVYYLIAEDVLSAADVDDALVLGAGSALGHHGQHDAQSSRRRPGRHRAFLSPVCRPDDDVVEDPRLAGAHPGDPEEAHRRRSCRGRIAHHRGTRSREGRDFARSARIAHQASETVARQSCRMTSDLTTGLRTYSALRLL